MAGDRTVGLGHARLSIIDLHTGDQPIASEDGRCVIVVNGEFYDFERIRSDLEARGHIFRTRGDSEIALHLYEEKGLDFLEDLRGEFAFVLWDGAARRLVAVRDRFGIKPCYFSEADDALHIASEIKAMYAFPVARGWDAASLFQQLFVGADQDRSLFQNIRRVPPGQFLLADDAGVRLQRYWDFDQPPETELSQDDAETHAERLEAALVEATTLRLRSDVPLGCYLSGGIDSASVLSIAADRGAAPPQAFSIQFDQDAFDESDAARLSATAAGAPFTALPVTRADLTTCFEKAVVDFEMLFENAHYVARERLGHAVHEAGMKVVLCGEGSDEIFAGYGACVQDMATARQGNGRTDPPTSRQANGRDDGHDRVIAHWIGELDDRIGFVPGFLRGLMPVRAMLHRCLSPDWTNGSTPANPYCRFLDQFDTAGQLAGRHPVRQGLYLWSKSIFANYILNADRVDMAHAIEVRLPFLDHHVVAVARTIPIDQQVDERRGKLLLRRAMRGRVPETIREGTKKLFTAPPVTVYDDELTMTMIQDRLRSRALDRVPVLDRARVVELLDGLDGLSGFQRLCLEPVLLNALSAVMLTEAYGL